MNTRLLRTNVRPNGVLWKNALAAYEKLCERRDWIRQRVSEMVLEEEYPGFGEETIYRLYLIAESQGDDAGPVPCLAVFSVFGDLDQPAMLEFR